MIIALIVALVLVVLEGIAIGILCLPGVQKKLVQRAISTGRYAEEEVKSLIDEGKAFLEGVVHGRS